MNESMRIAKALQYADMFGGIGGGHHKQWVIDQMVRALTDCPIVVKSAIDAIGRPYNYESQSESEEYLKFVAEHNAGEDGPETYSWEEGVTR